jgi:hypothetical protein
MAEPSWKQLSLIPESVLKTTVLRACGIEPPVSAICRFFDGGLFRVFATVPPGVNYAEGIQFTLYQETGSRLFDDYKDVLRAAKSASGTPTGDALRSWFAYYTPKP